MNSVPVRRHALGLPAGSIRAAHMLVIVSIVCALILNPRDIPVPIPAYLIYLLFLMLGHYFASHGTSIAARDSGQSSPLHLPAGTIRLLVIVALCGTVGWKYSQNPDSLQQQFELSLEGLKDQPFLPVIILGAFLAGVVLRSIVGRTNPPKWLQDFEAWVSILALVGLGVAAVIHLIVTASLEVPWMPLPTWEGILGAVIAFYFGERS